MSDQAIFEKEGISRRSFLRGGLGAGIALVAIQSLGAAMVALQGCASPGPSSYPDLIVTSSLDLNHTHKITIPGADISAAPAEKTYTSDGPTHTHAITLKKADFDVIKNKQTVTVTSTTTGATPHPHTFEIKLA